jgi:hypothetical protein
VVAQEDFQGLAEVLDEMEAIDHLYGLGRAPANAIGVEVAPITTDHADRRILGQPGRDTRGRAVRQEVHDAVVREVDQDRAVPMAPPPGPLVDTNGLEGWRERDRSPPDQAEQRGWTGGEPQAGGQSGPSVPAQRQTDGLKSCGQSMGVASIGRNEVRQALGENATRTGRVPAEELPDRELEVYGVRRPRKVRQVALIATMDRR